MKNRVLTPLITLSLLACVLPSVAQTVVFTYQGFVQDSGTNYTGTGLFKFGLVTSLNTSLQATATANAPSGGYITGYTVTAGGSGYLAPPSVTVVGGGGLGAQAKAEISSGGVVTNIAVVSPGNGSYSSVPTVTVGPPPVDLAYTTYWSNDGTSVNGSEPSSAVAISVNNGLFTVALGDATLGNMETIPASLFTARGNLQLQIWFSDGLNGFALLNPVQNLTPTPYAAMANSASNLVGTLPASQLTGSFPPQLTGTINSVNFGGSYYNQVTLANAANQFNGTFTGIGVNLADVNAAELNGLNASAFWQIGGNTVSSGQFIGSLNNQAVELWAGKGRALRLEPGGVSSNADSHGYSNPTGAPNVIGGATVNYVAAGVVGATIGGGGATNYLAQIFSNSVTADFGTVGGGVDNTVSGLVSSICGGVENTASGELAVISGGDTNTASGDYSTVGGGHGNSASFSFSEIGGGDGNSASGQCAAVSGGLFNAAQAAEAAVGGGYSNTVTSSCGTVPGGAFNIASGRYSFAAGYMAQAADDGDFVWADAESQSFSSTGVNQFLIRAAGGVGIGENTPAGALHITGPASRPPPSLPSADNGLVLGTTGTSGYKWIQSFGGPLVLNPTSNDVGISTTNPTHLFQVVNAYCDGNNWYPASDRNLKSGFKPVNAVAVLAKVAAMPITTWHYTNDVTTPHIGPMAQDFYAAFEIGADNKHIGDVDEAGVALAAIQGLNQKLEAATKDKDVEIAMLKQKADKVDSLEKQLSELRQMVQVLAARK